MASNGAVQIIKPEKTITVVDRENLIKTYGKFAAKLTDETVKDEIKAQIVLEISENFELLSNSGYFSVLIEHMLVAFTKYIIEGKSQLISEMILHQIRKAVFEILYRIPFNEPSIAKFLSTALVLCMKVTTIDNEEVVIICIRTIIDFMKAYKPPYQNLFVAIVGLAKKMYEEFPKRMADMFVIRPVIRINVMFEKELDTIIKNTYQPTTVEVNKGFGPDGKPIIQPYTFIPKSENSIKVMQELPNLLILMHQLYKDNLGDQFAELVPLAINMLTVRPPKEILTDKNFNRELYVEFVGAQAKVLCLVSYTGRVYQDLVFKNAPMLVEGVFNLLRSLPKDATHHRRELLSAVRHILSSDLRVLFIPHVDKLFEEDILLKHGYTTFESLRPLTYSTLADFVHHTRQHISFTTILKSMRLYSVNIHDESLNSSIQNMSCRLLLNLVDYIKQRSEVDKMPNNELCCQTLIMKIARVLILKFKPIARIYIPHLKFKAKQAQGEKPPSDESKLPDLDINGSKPNIGKVPEDKMRFDIAYTAANNNYTVADIRTLIKSLVSAVKIATCGYVTFSDTPDPNMRRIWIFTPKEVSLYVKFVKYSFLAFDLYSIPQFVLPSNASPTAAAAALTAQRSMKNRNKDETETFEHYIGCFAAMHHHSFKQIISLSMAFIVNRLKENPALFVINDGLLGHAETSLTYGNSLIEHLVDRMKDMGSGDTELSNVFLKLFKSIFDSIAVLPQNEAILQPHLRQIINKCMELALITKEPLHYFILLRNLFRSIGGANQDSLYQEFLPLLPQLLQTLNSLQAGSHKQQMKDVFIELCLTVPVRLSTLLPYLPMLMDPLVSALNSSQNLISQGLRTLELCVDNLQPDFLYDHIQPIRGDMMQALWRSLHNNVDQVAHVAFRVLGKFGGANRNMIGEPQTLKYNTDRSDNPEIVLYFTDYTQPIKMGVHKAIETAVTALKASGTDIFYRKQSWEVIKGFLLSSIRVENLDICKLMMHPCFQKGPIPDIPTDSLYKYNVNVIRTVHVIALTGMFVGASNVQLAPLIVPTMVAIIRHYTMIAVSQQAGPFAMNGKVNMLKDTLDPLIVVDAISLIMGYDDKTYCKVGLVGLTIMLHTAKTILGSEERACKLPLMKYVVEKLCGLCFERPWYTKLGGCIAVEFLCSKFEKKWVFENTPTFVKSQLFVMMDLCGEVSNGAVDKAKSNLETMIREMAIPIADEESELPKIQKTALFEITYDLTRQVTSPNDNLREEAMYLLKVLAEVQNKSITKMMECHKAVLVDMIPPKTHLLRHQAVNAQIGLMEGTTFCTTLNPRLFTIDFAMPEHKTFFTEVSTICEVPDSNLVRLACYKSVPSLIPIRKAAMRVLSTCHYLPNVADKVFTCLYNCLEKPHPEIQETAFVCIKNFIVNRKLEIPVIHDTMRPLLATLCDHRNVDVNIAQRVSYLVQLFPGSFKERLCEQLLQHMEKFFDNLLASQLTVGNKIDVKETEKILIIILEILYHTPSLKTKSVEALCKMIMRYQTTLCFGFNSKFNDPFFRILARFPTDTVRLFTDDINLREYEWATCLIRLLKHPVHGKLFSDEFNKIEMSDKLIDLIEICKKTDHSIPSDERLMIRYNVVHICYLLTKRNEQWLMAQKKLYPVLIQLWTISTIQDSVTDSTIIPAVAWDELKLLLKLLMVYQKITARLELLMSLTNIFTVRIIFDIQFFKDYLEEWALKSPVETKRQMFIKFCELYVTGYFSDDAKLKIFQYLLIPSFTASFENGETDALIVGTETSNENIVVLFLTRILEPVKKQQISNTYRIVIQHFAIKLVQYAPHHISNNQLDGTRLRMLMEFEWPSLVNKKYVDITAEMHGYLLICHIIEKFGINKKIIIQVFRNLLKAYSVDVRPTVKQALDILTPLMLTRLDKGVTILSHWTKKILVEEGHFNLQMIHILQFIHRHYKVYFATRFQLAHCIINCINKLNTHPSPPVEFRKVTIDMCELIIRWEILKITDNETYIQQELNDNLNFMELPGLTYNRFKLSELGPQQAKNLLNEVEQCTLNSAVIYLIQFTCQNFEFHTGTNTHIEYFNRRSVNIVKTALKSRFWPPVNPDLRYNWLDKIHLTITGNIPVICICSSLEILFFLLSFLNNDEILYVCNSLQLGLLSCLCSNNPKVMRLTQFVISRLMQVFPPEINSTTGPTQYEQLDRIYSMVYKVIHEGLTAFEKSTPANLNLLYSPLILIKTGMTSTQAFMDKFSAQFVRVILRLSREGHTVAAPDPLNPANNGIDVLITAMDMIKNRVGAMKMEARKIFIGVVITGLIEKTQDAKMMRALCKIMEDWMSNRKNADYCGPNIQEKSVLLLKMLYSIEKRFSDINTQFLEIIYNIYKDEIAKPTELMVKLEVAFLAGLRSRNPELRMKFFKLFDESIPRKLISRLQYIVASQNWEGMNHHYWLKQCLELLLVTVRPDDPVKLFKNHGMLPSITSVVEIGDIEQQILHAGYFHSKNEPMEIAQDDTELMLINSLAKKDAEIPCEVTSDTVQILLTKQTKFLDCIQSYKLSHFLQAVCQLCHADTSLTEEIWLLIFPQIWSILDERQRFELMGEITPFIASGSHVIQKDAHPSAICTFYEGLAHCRPAIEIKPRVMVYMAKTHNLWHRVALGLERTVRENDIHKFNSGKDCYKFEDETANRFEQEVLDSLADLYEGMREDDMMSGVWQRHAKHSETVLGLTFEQQGFFEKAMQAYELVMGKSMTKTPNEEKNVTMSEQRLWENHWIRCAKELNQWDNLLEYSQTKGAHNPVLLLESAWRVSDWDLVKETISQIDISYPGLITWKADLFKGYLAVCHPQDKELQTVERFVEQASVQCIKEWRKLPSIASSVHIKLLQAAQQITELQESFQIHQNLLHGKSTQAVHDMKAIVKTWRNRLPTIGDDLSHWSDIFTWRQQQYQFITSYYDGQQDGQSANHSILGVHASAQAIIHFGKIARKQNLTSVCLDSLQRLYSIPSVPIVDCFQKILQQVKCYQQMSRVNGRNELQEGLDVIEYTNIRYLTKEMTSEFYALKGMLLSQMDRPEDANKSFSVSLQMCDTLIKGWGLWGEFLESQFLKRPDSDIQLGVSAMLCYLNACKHQTESKARKYLSKVIWLITYDDEKYTLMDAVDKYHTGIPAAHWLPWIAQLLTCLTREEGTGIVNLINQIGRLYPQAVYFPIRTIYFTHKIEQRERHKSANNADKSANSTPVKQDNDNTTDANSNSPSVMMNRLSVSGTGINQENPGLVQVKASQSMMRCSRIMQMLREVHPTILLSLEGIVDQMVWFREYWSEEVLRQLKLGLAKSYALAFENRGAINDANISMATHNFLKKLVSTFGTGLEMYANTMHASFSNAGSESLAKRTQMTMSDPVFQTMKQQFAQDFDFTVPGAKKLHNFITKLRRWIQMLEKIVNALPKSFRIEEKCRYLSNFSLQTAEIELPGEFLIPKHQHYYVKIAKFMPRIEVVEKHNTATRRLYIRGHNGKTYAYLIMQESTTYDARREETVLQLMRMLNHILSKRKETSRRYIGFTIPRVVAVSPQLRLVEDNPSSLSLLDVSRTVCTRRHTQYDEPIVRYYDRLSLVQAKGGQTNYQVLREILTEIQASSMPPNMLNYWARETYTSPTDFWTFRKTFTTQIALSCFAEYVFHLTRMNPEMIYIHRDSGLLNIAYYKFDVDDTTGQLDANRAVPFRLTPNLTEFITEIGITGPLISSMIAAANAFSYPNFQLQSILKALLRDEMFAACKRKQEECDYNVDDLSKQPADIPGQAIIDTVINSVNSIMQRLSSLTHVEGVDNQVSTLVTAARNFDNLCRMDPTWHPWL